MGRPFSLIYPPLDHGQGALGVNASPRRAPFSTSWAAADNPQVPMSSTLFPIILAAAVVLGCSEAAIAPTAQSDVPTHRTSAASQVVHRVTSGSPDLCAAIGAKPGCDANYSLVAQRRADGSVTGEYHDQFTPFPGFGGTAIHIAVNCLNVIGNQAWISGVVTQSHSRRRRSGHRYNGRGQRPLRESCGQINFSVPGTFWRTIQGCARS